MINLPADIRLTVAEQSLKDLGSFGIPHVDNADLSEGFTAIQVCSDLPADVDPGKCLRCSLFRLRQLLTSIIRHLKGQFIVHELGVFIELEGTIMALFRGVQFHGGCAPRPRTAFVSIPQWAYRLVFVSYPKRAVYLGLCTYILGALRTVRNKVRLTSALGSRVVQRTSDKGN